MYFCYCAKLLITSSSKHNLINKVLFAIHVFHESMASKINEATHREFMNPCNKSGSDFTKDEGEDNLVILKYQSINVRIYKL